MPADVELITLPHTGLRVRHSRLDITGYREPPTVDVVAFTATLRLDRHHLRDREAVDLRVAFTATLRLDRHPVGLIQNRGVGGATTFHPDASAGFGCRELEAYAHASRTPGGFRATGEGVLDDLITEILTARRAPAAPGPGAACYGCWPCSAARTAEATLVRGPADRVRLIAQLQTGAPKPGEWWQLRTGDRRDNLTSRHATPPTPTTPDRQPARQTRLAMEDHHAHTRSDV